MEFLPVVSHKSLLDRRQVLELLGNPWVPDGLLDPPVDPLVPLVVGEGHVLEEVVLLGGGIATVLVAAPVLPDPFKDKYKGENKADNVFYSTFENTPLSAVTAVFIQRDDRSAAMVNQSENGGVP